MIGIQNGMRKDFAANLHEDTQKSVSSPKTIKKTLQFSKVKLKDFNISVHTGKPGMVIGKGGA